MPPEPGLFRHFIEDVRGLTGMMYGRCMYEEMRYWDNDLPDWDAEEREYAAVWRSQAKWVVSRSMIQRYTRRGRPRSGGARAEGPARRGDRSRRTGAGGESDRAWSH